jgi:antitoxin MazE
MGGQPPQCDEVKRLIKDGGCAVYIPTDHAYNEYTSTYIHKGANMNLHIAKWGNSLAVRIPMEYIRRTGLKEGDTVQASLTADGTMTIRAEPWDRKAFTAELTQTRQSMKMGTSVMDELRGGARY